MLSRSNSGRNKQNHQHSRPSPPLRRLGLYERSLRQQEERERKMNNLRADLMKDCTFTPNISAKVNPAGSSNHTTTTRTSSSSRSGGDESVFERLYRNGGSVSSGSKGTPVTSNCSGRRSATSPADRSTMSRASSTATSRIESLYEEGVRKLRNRPVNDAAERELREKEREEKELQEHCTFRPQSANKMTKSKSSTQFFRRSNHLVMEPIQGRSVPGAGRRSPGVKGSTKVSSPSDKENSTVTDQDVSFPKEIVVTQHFLAPTARSPPATPYKQRYRRRSIDDSGSHSSFTKQRWRTPMRRSREDDESFSPDFVVVSPLRDHFFYSSMFVYPDASGGEQLADGMTEAGQATEYGSI